MSAGLSTPTGPALLPEPRRDRRLGGRPLLWLLIAAVLSLPAGAFAQSRPSVVVSLHPIYDLVRQIAGDEVEVTRLLPPGASPHTFDPKPSDAMRIARADLLVINGGLDLWLRDLLLASGSGAPILEIIAIPDVLAALHEDFPDLVPRDASGNYLSFNTHVWLDPVVMSAALPAIASALAGVAPDHETLFVERAAALAADLLRLDMELSQLTAPTVGQAFVPFHDAWPYFAARYGLDLVVEIEPFPGREPSVAYLRAALALIEDSGARALFTESQLNRRPAEVLAEDAGLPLYEMDPLGGVAGRETYQELLRFNARVVLEALR